MYITYCQLHYYLLEHPSPIGHGWEMRDGKCRAMCYASPLYPSSSYLVIILQGVAMTVVVMSECGESTDACED